MSSKRVKLGMLNSLILMLIAIYLFILTSYQLIAIILILSSLISVDNTGTLYDAQNRLRILRGL